MKLVFVSNYINHHQIPFSNALYQEVEGNFRFIQTEPMEEERVRMGWNEEEAPSYVMYSYNSPEECQNWIMDSDIVIYGGAEDESYIKPRLKAGKSVFRYSERLYKTGQWKAISPRGLMKKYHDHTRYRKDKVYLLCAGAYVSSDFDIIRAYPDKMFRWGYFTEAKQYDVADLMEAKGSVINNQKVISLLWAGRIIPYKHPQLAVGVAKHLKERGIPFHLDIIGGGEMEDVIKAMIAEYKLVDCVTLRGFKKPEEVRTYMEKADIYLATSNREEGWGAVINEAMNSGCAVVANHTMGAAPYLISHEENGLIYEDGKEKQLYNQVERLATEDAFRKKLGIAAYETITQVWNPENAAACLMKLIRKLKLTADHKLPKEGRAAVWTANGPGSKAPVISERKMYRYLITKNR